MSKKYKVGFTAGTFDLFHVGHLNILRKSKELCEYLIVGVMTDEFVEHQKGRKPVISLEDRMEMLAACSYVDEVVPVDYHNTHKQDAWSLYHFDCVFTGNDHEGPEWYHERDLLRSVGSEMIFFPYTERISSTKIKKTISEVRQEKIKIGYMPLFIDDINESIIYTIEYAKRRCDKLVIGLLSDELYCYSKGFYPQKNFASKKEILLKLKDVDEVTELTWDCYTKEEVFSAIHYDIVFIGSEYGKYYLSDKHFFDNNGIVIETLLPERVSLTNCEDSLKVTLSGLYSGKKIILWGTGKYFDYYMQKYGAQFKPDYAVDSNKDKWNTEKQGVYIKNPQELTQERTDMCIIIVCCKNHAEVIERLEYLGDYDYRLLRYHDNISLMEQYDVALREQRDYMAEVKEVLMGILKQFDEICTKYHLNYYVISGSLIGVVRHHSLIPWDDDIDIAMTRNDFNVLKEKCKEMFSGTNLEFVDYDNLGEGLFLDYMARVVCTDKNIPNGTFHKVEKQLREDIKNKMVMDIYVLDEASDDINKHKKHVNRIKMIYALAMGHRDFVDYNEYRNLPKLKLFAIKMAVSIGKMIPVKILFKLYEKERLYAQGENGRYYFESNGVSSHIIDLYEKKFFGEGQRMAMDDLQVMVPKDTDGLLKAKGYGDYMQLPWPAARKPERMKNSRAVVLE